MEDVFTFHARDTCLSFQGEVLDRIDCNIENTHVKVKEGVQHLKKAEMYQRKNRKMKCIVILAVIVIVLLFVLLIKIS